MQRKKYVTLRLKVIVGLVLLIGVLLWPKGWDRGILTRFTGDDRSPALRMQLSNEPTTLDYSLAEDGVSLRVLSAVMSGLVTYDRDYNLKMELAESMERLEGGRRYRFKLKPWQWSDGKEVTAHDFVYSIRRTLEPGVAAKLADLLFFIKNARAYKKGQLKDFSQVGVTALSDKLLEFTLDAPVSFFPHILTLTVGYPQRQDQVDKLGAQWYEHMVSTGPYRLVRWLHDQRIEIEQNPSYPGFPSDAPKRAVFQIIPEEATALNLFENNRLDVLFKVPSFDLDRLRKRGVVHDFPYFATYYLAFDQRKAPWSDRRARLALAQAIDRKAVVDALGGGEQLATSWIPRGLPGYNNELGVKYDPTAARKNWEQSAGRAQKSLVLGYDTSFRNQSVLERVQSDLRETLGVEVRLRNRDWKTYLRELSLDTPPLYRFGWLSPFVDAYANLVVFQSDNPNNYTGWKSKAYDDLLSKIAVTEPSDPKRQKLIDQAQRLLTEEAVTVVPIFHYVQTVIVSPRVSDFWVNGMGMVDLLRVRATH